MEFEVKPFMVPERIEFNADAIKAYLEERTKVYNTMVVTDVKAAKADRAKLNAMRTAMEDRRKALKRTYLEPYMAFEAQYKEVLALLDAPIAHLDGQIKAMTPKKEEAMVTGVFKVTAGKTKIKALAKWMRENGIQFEALEG